nr:unnamed protein product [Digitaria exilis]
MRLSSHATLAIQQQHCGGECSGEPLNQLRKAPPVTRAGAAEQSARDPVLTSNRMYVAAIDEHNPAPLPQDITACRTEPRRQRGGGLATPWREGKGRNQDGGTGRH